MKKRQPDTSVYKTEDMLKEEAKQRAAEQARLAAARPQPTVIQKKRENFWYHYKWHTIGGAFALIMIAFFVKDVVFSTKADATVIVVSATHIAQETIESVQAGLEKFAGDFNGDGKTVIQLDYIYLPTEAEGGDEQMMMGGQQDYASVMKLTTVIAAGSDPIYLMDDKAYEHLKSMANGGEEAENSEDSNIFMPLDLPGAQGDRLPISASALADEPGTEPVSDLTFSMRLFASDKNSGYYEYCLELLSALAE